MSLEYNEEKTIVSKIFQKMARLSTENGFGPNKLIGNHIRRLKLPELIYSFPNIEQRSFLSNSALNYKLLKFSHQRGNLRTLYPQQSEITLMALPCDPEGFELEQEDLNDLTSNSFPYLHELITIPNQYQNITRIQGTNLAPFVDIIPFEVYQHCTFKPDYSGLQNANEDYDYFIKKYMVAFGKLRYLFFRNS